MKNNNQNMIFCDESGFGGGIKEYGDYNKFIDQPIFITSGIFASDENTQKNIEKKYEKFLIDNNLPLDVELKGDLFKKENNDLLKKFISLFINEDYWFISVIDKKFDLCVDALWLFFPNTINKETWDIYEILQKNHKKKDFIIKEYFTLLKSEDLDTFYSRMFSQINFMNNRYVNKENLKSNYDLYLKNYKVKKFNHKDSLFYLIDLIETHDNIYETLNKKDANQLLSKYNIIYDNNDQFKNLNENDYFPNMNTNLIQFEDSKKNLLIQFADNISRVFYKFFKYKLYQQRDEIAENIFEDLNINFLGKANLMFFINDQNNFINSNMDFKTVISNNW